MSGHPDGHLSFSGQLPATGVWAGQFEVWSVFKRLVWVPGVQFYKGCEVGLGVLLASTQLGLFLSGGGTELLGAEFQALGPSEKSLGLDTARGSLPLQASIEDSGLW